MKKRLGVLIVLVLLILAAAVPVGADGGCGDCGCEPCPPPPCDEGCTPGYWKQEQHFDSWEGYSTDDMFDDVFGVGPSITLLEALNARRKDYSSGAEAAMLRHAVAALLNAANSDVNYGEDTDWVIEGVNLAYAGELGFEYVKDVFEDYNERHCPLN
jgi:hypothetical protein